MHYYVNSKFHPSVTSFYSPVVEAPSMITEPTPVFAGISSFEKLQRRSIAMNFFYVL